MPGGRLKWLAEQQRKQIGLVIEPKPRRGAKKKSEAVYLTRQQVRQYVSSDTDPASSDGSDT